MTSREVPHESEIQSKLVDNSTRNDGSISLLLFFRDAAQGTLVDKRLKQHFSNRLQLKPTKFCFTTCLNLLIWTQSSPNKLNSAHPSRSPTATIEPLRLPFEPVPPPSLPNQSGLLFPAGSFS